MQWTKTEEGWYLKTSAKPAKFVKQEQLVPGHDSKMQKETGCKTTRNDSLLSKKENDDFQSLCIIYYNNLSRRTPTLKASETQPWEIFLPDLMPTWTATFHESDAVSDKLQSSVLTQGFTTNRSHMWLLRGKAILLCCFPNTTNMSPTQLWNCNSYCALLKDFRQNWIHRPWEIKNSP